MLSVDLNKRHKISQPGQILEDFPPLKISFIINMKLQTIDKQDYFLTHLISCIFSNEYYEPNCPCFIGVTRKLVNNYYYYYQEKLFIEVFFIIKKYFFIYGQNVGKWRQNYHKLYNNFIILSLLLSPYPLRKLEMAIYLFYKY